MRIAEIFRSVQGEGRLTGTESIFIRTSGCNLRCRYCDTPYASSAPEGEDLSIAEIIARVEVLGGSSRPRGERGVKHIVITGGEPMLFAELIPLCAAIHQQGRHITIETAGTIYLPVACDLMSISPKLSNSTPCEAAAAAGSTPARPPRAGQWPHRHETNRYVPEVIRRLAAEYDCQFKFVIDCEADCREVEEYLASFPEIARSQVMLMPQGTEAAELTAKTRWLEPYCRTHGLQFCPRRQIEWFGARRGT